MTRWALAACLLAACGGARAVGRAIGSPEFFTPVAPKATVERSGGLKLLIAGQADAAAQAFARAVAADAADDVSRYQLAVALAESHRSGQAQRELAVVLEHDPLHFGAVALADPHLGELGKGWLEAQIHGARAAFAHRVARPGLRFVAALPKTASPRSGSLRDVYQLDLETGRYIRLSDAGELGTLGSFVTSSDGRWLVYTRAREARRPRELLRDLVVVVVDLQSGEQRAAMPVSWDAQDITLYWEAGVGFWGETHTDIDSVPESMLPQYDVVEGDSEIAVRRFAVDPEGGVIPERSRKTARAGGLFAWFARPALPTHPAGETAAGIWFHGDELRLRAGRVLSLPDRGAAPALSPSGRYLAFSLDRNECDLSEVGNLENELFLLDLATLELTSLAHGRSLFGKVWIDDEHLVYEVGADPDSMRLRVHKRGVSPDLAIGPETPIALKALPALERCAN